jgi:Fe-S cluster biogenesis protein NfuA
VPTLPQANPKTTTPAHRRRRVDHPLAREVEVALDLIRPAIRDDGGDVELVDIDGSCVRIRFHGACIACPSSEMTLRDGIERHLVGQVDGVDRVEAVDG